MRAVITKQEMIIKRKNKKKVMVFKETIQVPPREEAAS